MGHVTWDMPHGYIDIEGEVGFGLMGWVTYFMSLTFATQLDWQD